MHIRYFFACLIICFLLGKVAYAALAIDGSVSATTVTANSIAATLTTTGTNDIIVLEVVNTSNNALATTVTDSAGLTWASRQNNTTWNGSLASVEEYYAKASSPLSSDVITVKWTSIAAGRVTAFGINGANFTTPFDTNGSLPANSGVASGNVSVSSISTDNANDILIAGYRGNTGYGRPGSFTQVLVTGTVTDYAYNIVSARQSSATFTYTSSGSAAALLFDAVRQASSPATTQDMFFMGAP